MLLVLVFVVIWTEEESVCGFCSTDIYLVVPPRSDRSPLATARRVCTHRSCTRGTSPTAQKPGKKNRLHFSRMRTARSLTISPSMFCSGGGGSAPRGGAWSCGGGAWSGGGGIPACTEADPPPPRGQNQTPVKTLSCPTSLRMIIIEVQWQMLKPVLRLVYTEWKRTWKRNFSFIFTLRQ